MLFMLVTALVFHVAMGWLNAAALKNIDCIVLTALVFHVPMG